MQDAIGLDVLCSLRSVIVCFGFDVCCPVATSFRYPHDVAILVNTDCEHVFLSLANDDVHCQSMQDTSAALASNWHFHYKHDHLWLC